MIESIKEVKTFIIDAKCECGGTYKTTGTMLNSMPPLYPHKCDNCEKEEVFTGSYPTITYQPC